MKLNSNCFLINCDLALTMRKICRVVAINESGHYRYIIEPQDQPGYLISALENNIRSPKSGEVVAQTRLFD